jgi:hypothetical protein
MPVLKISTTLVTEMCPRHFCLPSGFYLLHLRDSVRKFNPVNAVPESGQWGVSCNLRSGFNYFACDRPEEKGTEIRTHIARLQTALIC